MGTKIRPEVSKKNKYWIDKYRHYELKYFCLQYPTWRRHHLDLSEACVKTTNIDRSIKSTVVSDPTLDLVILRDKYASKIRLVEKVAKDTDPQLWRYILRAVTEGLSYAQMSTRLDIPCSRDTFYDRYRRFFWLLNQSRS